MGKTSYYTYRLTRLFPPDDEYAATMARLCILWEDFITEATGGAATSIKEMDGHSAQWRRLYFLRRSIGTVHEIREAFRCLSALDEFREALSRQPQQDRENYVQSYRKLRKHEKQISQLRNAIGGGHVDQSAVKDGLAAVNTDTVGMLQKGEIYRDIRFKFAHPIVLEVLFKDSEEAEGDKQIEELTNFMHEAVSNALKMIEFSFRIYVRERGVTPL